MKRGLVMLPFLAGACPPVEPGDPFVPDTDVDWTAGPPIARCEAIDDTIEPLTDEAVFSGVESFDPKGAGALSYAWSIASAPPRGTAPLDGATTSELSFVPNVAGTWIAQLVVANSEGATSEPCSAPVQVVPSHRLWVELSWDNTNDDLDLHLLQSGATYGSDSDCYQRNCTPIGTSPQLSWGGAGSDDDPVLFADSFDKGPEIGAILDPSTGAFEIAVADSPNSNPGNTQARVRVFVDGTEVYTAERSLREEPVTEGELVWFAKVQFPAGTVTACPPSGC